MKKKLFALVAFLVMLPLAGLAQDYHVPIFQPASPIVLNQPGALMNRVFIIRPITPYNTLYFFITNQSNSAETWTVTAFQTPDSGVADYTNNQKYWQQSNLNSSCNTVTNAATVSCYLSIAHAAQVALKITGATTGAGTDAFNLYVVQSAVAPRGPLGMGAQTVIGPDTPGTATTGNPVLAGGGDTNGFTQKVCVGTGCNLASNPKPLGLAPAGTSALGVATTKVTTAITPSCDTCGANGTYYSNNYQWEWGFAGSLVPKRTMESMWLYNGLAGGTSWQLNQATTNPGANADIVSLFYSGNGGGADVWFRKAVITCSAACEIQVFRVTANGATCTSLTGNIAPSYLTGTTAYSGAFNQTTNGTAQTACTTNPTTGLQYFDLTLAAGIPYELDLSGLAGNPAVASTPGGLMFLNKSAVTGVVSVTVQWAEIS